MEAIQSFDLSVLNAIQQTFRCGFLDGFCVFLSYFTTSGIIWLVLGAVLLFFRKTRAAGVMVLAAYLLVFLTGDLLLKNIIGRPRPFVVNPDVTLLIKQPSGASFPSTHCSFAAAVTTVLLAKKRPIGFAALALTVCIAFSRLYLYVHFPTDVIGGLLFGTLIGIVVILLAKGLKLENRLSGSRKQ